MLTSLAAIQHCTTRYKWYNLKTAGLSHITRCFLGFKVFQTHVPLTYSFCIIVEYAQSQLPLALPPSMLPYRCISTCNTSFIGSIFQEGHTNNNSLPTHPHIQLSYMNIRGDKNIVTAMSIAIGNYCTLLFRLPYSLTCHPAHCSRNDIHTQSCQLLLNFRTLLLKLCLNS